MRYDTRAISEQSCFLNQFNKPDLLLGYINIDEGVPLISDGLVLEMNRKTLDKPVDYMGDAPEGLFTYFAGTEVETGGANERFKKW